jgi:hypothetical protein
MFTSVASASAANVSVVSVDGATRPPCARDTFVCTL